MTQWRWLLTFVLLVAQAAAALPLWELEGARGRVQLLGSIHFLRASDFPLPTAMERAYDEADVLVMEDPCLLARQLEDRLGPRRPLRLLHGGAVGAARDVRLHHLPDRVEVYREFAENRRRDSLPLTNDPEEQVFGPEVAVV